MVPAAGSVGPVEGPAPAPILIPPKGTARAAHWVTEDDLWGSSYVSIRQAGSDLWTRADLTCCAGDTCRSEAGAETEATFDRAALCGRPRLPRLWTVGLGLAMPDAEIALSVARWPAEKRLGWYGALRYSLDPAVTDRVEPAGVEHYHGGPAFRTFTETADRLRIEGGMVLRMGR